MIPESLREVLPAEGVSYYKQAFASSYSRNSDEVFAHKVAWELTKRCMREENGVLVANSEDFIAPRLYRFALEPAEEVIIKNSDNGEIELDAVLATTEARKTDGYRFDEEALSRIAEQINTEGSTFPDIDHETLTKLEAEFGYDPEVLAAAIKREKGVFTKIKAVVRDGKLWIKAFLDKRYKNYVDRFSKLSIEALAKPTADRRLVAPRYLGFTFTDNPQLSGAGVAS